MIFISLFFIMLMFGFIVLMVLGLISPAKGLFWAKFIKEKTRSKAIGINIVGVILCFIVIGLITPEDKTDYYKLGNEKLTQKKYGEAIVNYNKIQKKNTHYGEINLLISKAIEEGNRNYNMELKKVSNENKINNIDIVIQSARKDLGDKFVIKKDVYEIINNKYIEAIKNCYFTDTEGYDIENANKIIESVKKNNFALNNEALEQIKEIKKVEYDGNINFAIEQGKYSEAIRLNNECKVNTGEYAWTKEDLEKEIKPIYITKINAAINENDIDKALQLNNEYKEYTGKEVYKDKEIEEAIMEKEKSTALRVKYSELLRYEDNYKGKFIVIEGQVFQTPKTDVALICTGNTGFGYMDDIAWVKYDAKSLKLVKNDIVEIWGTYKGEKKYDSANGAEQTCVEIDAKYWSAANAN